MASVEIAAKRAASEVFAPSRSAGLERMQAFLPNSGARYASTRNADYGPHDRSNVSVLSPYIRHRLILETEVLDAVLGRYALSTAEKFVQEVFWRTYFKGWLEHRPSVWASYRDDVRHWYGELEDSGQLRKRYVQAVEGRTGIDCFDAWSQELIETGYLHNHARMWFASIWIFTLDLPWQLGADFFYRHLMDADPASNTCSWRWVGGLHTQGKTYLARPDNIEKYTNGRFAPHGQLAGSAAPLSEPVQHGKRPVPRAADQLPDGKTILVLTQEDCRAEELFAAVKPDCIVALRATSQRSPGDTGDVASEFEVGAMADAIDRATAQFGCDVHDCGDADDWSAALSRLVQERGADTVITAYAPVGPVAEQLSRATDALSANGITLSQFRRPIDDLSWPHATRGFYGLKKKIPDILEDLERELAPRLL